MNLFLEHPAASALVGIAICIALGIVWAKTGRQHWLYLLGGVILLTIAGLIIEQAVETDREAIERTLAEITRDVESNDLPALLRHIASTAPPEVRQTAEMEMPNYKFTECRITRIFENNIDADGEPKKAIVEFNVLASGSFSGPGVELSDSNVLRYVRLHMIQEKDGRWTVESYEHAPPKTGMRSPLE